MEWQVSLNNNSFDRAGITKDCQDAVCEYIWNGFEAGASEVCVSIQGESLQEAPVLVIADNGSGIKYENFKETFGTFLASTKNERTIRIKSQANKGKGRFSYLSFSPSAEWSTTYADAGQIMQYVVTTDSVDKSRFDTTTPVAVSADVKSGTSASFPLIDVKIMDQLSFAAMEPKLLEEFAWYLHLNAGKQFVLTYMGTKLDVSQYISTELSRTFTEIIGNTEFKIDIVVWKSSVSNSSKIYYLSEDGEIVSVENTSFNKNKVRFYHAVFVSSDLFMSNMHFPGEQEEGPLLKDPQTEELRKKLRELKKLIFAQVSEVLKEFLVLQADVKLAEMESKGNFPTFDNDEYGKLRKKDFQTVTRELYCVEPRIFHKLNDKQERSLLGFLSLLLSSDERENVLQIVEQVVSLTPEQRKTFADVLQQSHLQYIVDAISIINRRVAVIQELKQIVFDAGAFANEREHIQKLIEQHFWLFGEQYHLLTADKNLATSLQRFEYITEAGSIGDELSISNKEIRQRVDIFLYSQRVQEDRTSEMLIVELKAPRVKLSLDVFNQIVRYANTLRKEPRFTSSNRQWRFFAVCAEVEDDVKVKYDNFKHLGKKGLADVIGNFELYALSWDDVFQAFEARHDFLLSKLRLDYSQIIEASELSTDRLASKADVTEMTDKLVAFNAS